MFLKSFTFGNTEAYYAETPVAGQSGKTTVGLALYPRGYCASPEQLVYDSLVQVAFRGDDTLVDYSSGITMRNREGSVLSVVEQQSGDRGVLTCLTDGKGNFYTHHLEYEPATQVFTMYVDYENQSAETRTLEMLSSFSLSGIASAQSGLQSVAGLRLRRMRSAWSRECRVTDEMFSDLAMEPSWANYGLKCERWGQVGSMPNRGYYPFVAVEEAGFCLGVQLEAPASWQMELCLERNGCALSGGQGDFEFAHWCKEIFPQERYRTRKAFVTVKNDFLSACNAFVHFFDSRLNVPSGEEDLPVIFNEYCTTWGNPTEENIDKILDALKGLPVETFVIDAGWYKPEGKEWGNAVGDWAESKEVFPNGISAVTDKIRAAGMRAGVWFEYEIAGRDSEAFSREELLLKRGGKTITCKNRRFFDLRLPETECYLQERLVNFLKEKHFTYLKIDYNDAYGPGCDGAESLGEGGRQVAEKSVCWLDKLRREIPELVIENCSSGGSRIEPLRMNKVSMCSFSDAHECAEIPLVAANVSRVIPARQSQIWAVLRKGEPDSRTVYSLCAAFIGRICLSGDVTELTEQKRELLLSGLNFYAEVKDIVRFGDIAAIDCNVVYYRSPKGRQVYRKGYNGRQLVLVHFLECRDELEIPLDGYRVDCTYTDLNFEEADGRLTVYGEPFHAGAFLLVKENG